MSSSAGILLCTEEVSSDSGLGTGTLPLGKVSLRIWIVMVLPAISSPVLSVLPFSVRISSAESPPPISLS